MTEGRARTVRPVDVAELLAAARNVVVVPGYGLGAAQAQHTLFELAERLEGRGVEVAYGVHPVAGRMPGHLNVLLDEAGVPYEAQLELEEANRRLATTDVALVVGASDIVDPAARTSPGSSLFGLPILEVGRARQVVVLKRSTRPGFAGTANALLEAPTTWLLFGDAEVSLTAVLGALTDRRPPRVGGGET